MGTQNRSTVIAGIILLIMIPVSLYFPVRQAARFRELKFSIMQIERNIEELSEYNRKLTGELTILHNPDRILSLVTEQASEDDVIIIKER